jgi:type I restriction enzyme S subunit
MFGDPVTNPKKLKKSIVRDVCDSIVRGPFGSTLKISYFVPKGKATYKVYEQKNAIQKSAKIGESYVTEAKFIKLRRFECKPSDIIMSCSGTIGELYQIPDNAEKGIINQALCKFTLNKKILPIVFLTFMRQMITNLEIKGSGMKNIGAVSYIKSLPIILPPLPLQNRFAAFVQQADKSKFVMQQGLEKLETMYKALMGEYFG